MVTLQRDNSYILKRGNKYITLPACVGEAIRTNVLDRVREAKWSSVESKAILFDSLDDAKKFLSSCRLKASIFVDRSFSYITTRENGSTVVEYESKLIKVI